MLQYSVWFNWQILYFEVKWMNIYIQAAYKVATTQHNL